MLIYGDVDVGVDVDVDDDVDVDVDFDVDNDVDVDVDGVDDKDDGSSRDVVGTPGPRAPPESNRPSRKITARSYSCTTFVTIDKHG